ncbi:MAG TPA: aminotransferase class V-fold PLP-dependent enzyme [Candidatus Polarisedimenticolaceae bacterium]|nr:aminotransferase class V-fold PLP-dependent enzyme [Candidatus Polarisedimenticolaceae bacterium]
MPWPLEPEPAELRRWIDRCAEFVVEHVGSLADQPSWDVEGAAELAASFTGPPPESGVPLEQVLARLGPAVAKSFNTAGPGYLAFIPGGGIPSSALAEFLGQAVNRYVGMNAAAPVLARIEALVVEWLAGLMGYPPTAGGVLTTGGSLSNLIAVVTARAAKLPENFLDGTLYVSEECHVSVSKAARIAGFPERAVRRVPVDARYRLVPAALEAAIVADRQHGLRPFLVVPSVGTTNTGAIDPLPEILAIARRHDLWVHADAAYGGFFRLVPDGAARMPGLEACDSITLDPHKGLFLPYGTGCLLAREPQRLLAAHRGGAGYLQDVAAAPGAMNFADISPELSREFRGLRLWLPLVLHGLEPFRRQLAEKLELARWAYDALRDDPRVTMLDAPQLSIVAFDAGPIGPELQRRVNARRRVFLSSSSIGGRYVLRLCVLSFRTHQDRIAAAVEAIREEAAALTPAGDPTGR